jgi:uncharacterized protein YbjT (DUF2867 family)
MNPSNSFPLLFLGAPGLIGSHVITTLTKAGCTVLAGSRRGLSVGGAPGVVVDLRDPESLARAMRGMAMVGLVIPDVNDMESLGLNAVAAAKAASVRRLLWFSSFGAKAENQARFSRRHPVIDEAVRASGIPYTILRPNFLKIRYQPISVTAMEASLREAGMEPWFAEGLAELYGWIRDSGLGSEVTDAVEELIGRKAIPFQQFAADNRSAWLD